MTDPPVMARLDRPIQYSPEVLVFTGSTGLACGSPEDDRQGPEALASSYRHLWPQGSPDRALTGNRQGADVRVAASSGHKVTCGS